MQLLWMFMLFVSHLAENRTAFSSILPCVLHQNARHLAPKRTPFSAKTHCILHQNARHLVANSPETGANGGLFK